MAFGCALCLLCLLIIPDDGAQASQFASTPWPLPMVTIVVLIGTRVQLLFGKLLHTSLTIPAVLVAHHIGGKGNKHVDKA